MVLGRPRSQVESCRCNASQIELRIVAGQARAPGAGVRFSFWASCEIKCYSFGSVQAPLMKGSDHEVHCLSPLRTARRNRGIVVGRHLPQLLQLLFVSAIHAVDAVGGPFLGAPAVRVAGVLAGLPFVLPGRPHSGSAPRFDLSALIFPRPLSRTTHNTVLPWENAGSLDVAQELCL